MYVPFDNFLKFVGSRPTDNDVGATDDAVAVDACGHDGRDGRELLHGARARPCGDGRREFLRLCATPAKNDAGFDPRRGRSQQHHESVNGI